MKRLCLGIPTDGYKAGPEAKPVGFTDYLSNFFSYFCLHYINIVYILVILTLSMSMRAYLIECVFDKWHNSKRCAYRRAQVCFGSVLTAAGATPPDKQRYLPLTIYFL